MIYVFIVVLFMHHNYINLSTQTQLYGSSKENIQINNIFVFICLIVTSGTITIQILHSTTTRRIYAYQLRKLRFFYQTFWVFTIVFLPRCSLGHICSHVQYSYQCYIHNLYIFLFKEHRFDFFKAKIFGTWLIA